MSNTPKVAAMEVFPVAGKDCMELNLSGAHAPYFTRNVVVITDDRGNTGIGEVPGGLCWCGCKATMNARVNGAGQVVKVGEQVLIDNQQSIRYIGLCYKHWKMGKAYA